MELASLQRRLLGAVIDGIVGLVPYGLVQTDADGLRILGALLFAALIGVQCWLLARDGQTIGKRLSKTRIVRAATDENGGFFTNVFLRALVASLPNIIPLYWAVDVLFIFRQDRRCVHDWIAGTKVVAADSAPAAG